VGTHVRCELDGELRLAVGIAAALVGPQGKVGINAILSTVLAAPIRLFRILRFDLGNRRS